MTQSLVYLIAAAGVVLAVISLKPTRANLALALSGVIVLFALLAVASYGPSAVVAVLNAAGRLFGH